MRRHFAMYLALCLLAAILGTEFSSSLTFSKIDTSGVFVSSGAPSSQTLGDVVDALMEGRPKKAKRISVKIREAQRSALQDPSSMFGHSRGVFAGIVNSVTSGELFVVILSGMGKLFGSTSLSMRLLILAALLAALLFWLFIILPYSAVSRRFFLEGRVYERLSPQRFLYPLRTGTWKNTVRILLRQKIFLLLWSLTLVGGIIKRYSYYMIPYIAAENPSIRSKEALRLSASMMKGHKWQCFVLELSFLWWRLLDVLTLGLSAVLFTNSYRMAVMCEYYAFLREVALKKKLPGSEMLNDYYLYEKAEDKLLFAFYRREAEELQKTSSFVDTRHRITRFFADNFGIILIKTPAVTAYERHMERQVQLASYQYTLNKELYPLRLGNLFTKESAPRHKPMHCLRSYPIRSLVLIYFALACAGWLWEVGLTLLTSNILVNRGVLHGPWLPIYGTGSLLILTLLNRLRKYPVREFFAAVLLSGILEYFISLYLENLYQGQRWWDYTGYFLNLNGRICAEGLLLFGVGALAVVYLVAPCLDSLIQRLSPRTALILCILLVGLFTVDQVVSSRHPNQSENGPQTEAVHSVYRNNNDVGVKSLCPQL